MTQADPFSEVPTILLRRPRGTGVAHLVLKVRHGKGAEALRVLRCLPTLRGWPAFGLGGMDTALGGVQLTLGFTWRGLEALCVPRAYLRTFSGRAPAFAAGAPARASRLGDAGVSGPSRWERGFGPHDAHVLLTLHAPDGEVERHAADVRSYVELHGALDCVHQRRGARLGAPAGETGEWVHFGYRDGLTDHRIAGVPGTGEPLPVEQEQPAGEFLLGHVNGVRANLFALSTAPEKVRRFFHHGSFAVYRPLAQDTQMFEDYVRDAAAFAPPELDKSRRASWVKAKLGGRWPGGQVVRPGDFHPRSGDYTPDLANDDGSGCPHASHVRRMRSEPADAHQRARPLLRRGMPYGPATWQNGGADDTDRGLLGLFFCAHLESQFEHLLGQWSNRRPLGSPDPTGVRDPLMGGHAPGDGPMPLRRSLLPRPQALPPFKAWTRTLGTLYAWCPGRTALDMLLHEDYVKPEDEGAWL